MNKLIRITTVPVSIAGLLRGQHRYMTQQGFEVVGDHLIFRRCTLRIHK